MPKNRFGKNHEVMRQQVLYVAAKSFLKLGYTNTTMKRIAGESGMLMGSLTNLFNTKEDILCNLVEYVLERQFKVAARVVNKITDDKILFYATEITMQLYIVESSEHIRDLYSAAYSMPKTSVLIQQMLTGKIVDIFAEHLPELKPTDFYKLGIATSGIMRGFMMVPCDMRFTMDQKVASFLETTFRVFCLPKEKIDEVIKFVSQFDYPQIAQTTLETMMDQLEKIKQLSTYAT